MPLDAAKLWEATLGRLQLHVPRASYDTWLRATVGLALDSDSLTVSAPTPFAAEWLERRMHHLIQQTVTEVAARPLEVRFQVGPLPQESHASPTGASRATIQTGLPLDGEGTDSPVSSPVFAGALNPRYTFQNFVTGSGNRLAYAAATAVAERPGEQYNPLFIYSGSGLGKTHLLHSIALAAMQNDLAPLYVTAEQFTNDFIQSIRERKTEGFRAKYRSADMLLMDDVQFLAGKEQTQEGLFHAFNDLHTANRQIVVACDQPPKGVPGLAPRLRSRLEWGLITDIQPPDLETRLAILREKASAQGLTLGQDVAQGIAQRPTTSIRELEGCLTRVAALAQFLDQPVSAALLRIALADIDPPSGKARTEPKEVISQVAKYFGVAPAALLARPETRRTTLEQRVAMYVLREALALPSKEVATQLGNWDRHTVRAAVTDIKQRIATDPAFYRLLLGIYRALGLTFPMREN
ncbi:MAG: chromosomal replication initiator protein DnaA [Chloroflexi bacterium]|nr:chromosomal replication initiator protein DnaA [Chloroflexota bacterium]